MKILKEAKKELLPVDFVANFISQSWDEVANLKANISGLKQSFTGTKEIEKILEDLLDAYLIAIGQLQHSLEKQDIIIPTAETKLKEELAERNEANIEKIEDEKIDDNNLELSVDLNDIEENLDEQVTESRAPRAEKEDFFNSDFEEPETSELDSDFKRWQRQNNFK